MPVEIGISKILKMDSIRAGNVNDYITKAKVTAEKLNKYNVVYVHIKGPDEFGHDGDAIGKQKNIEKIDENFFGTLIAELNIDDAIIMVSGDHSTPCVKKSHSDDPVPLLISGNQIPKDGSKRFTEFFAKKGNLGTLNGIRNIGYGYQNGKIILLKFYFLLFLNLSIKTCFQLNYLYIARIPAHLYLILSCDEHRK